MSDPDKTVFISYRRSVSSFIARAIFGDLRMHGYDVFMDVESIDSGSFDSIIDHQIAARAHFLIICTPGTFESCDKPGDMIRHEVEIAMAQGRNIVPVLANNFRFEDNKTTLTGKLADLPRRNGLLLVHEYFDAGMDKLRARYLNREIDGPIRPAPESERSIVEAKIQQMIEQADPTVEELTAEEYFLHGLARPVTDFEGQIADFSRAISLNPNFSGLYHNRGLAYARQGDFTSGLEDFNTAIHLDPHNAEVYTNRGVMRDHLGDFAGAIFDYDIAIHLASRDARAYSNRGLIRARQGDLAGALLDYNHAIKYQPEFAQAYCNRGAVFQAQGDLPAAISDYDRALRLDPKMTGAYGNRAVARAAQGDLTGALADYSQIVALDPENVASRTGRGEIHFALKRYEDSRADFEAALKRDPADRFAQSGLAVALFALGQIDEAKARWGSLVAVEPGYANADWVGAALGWHPSLIEAARKLIAALNS